MQALIVYWSQGGNTRKAAQALQAGLQEAGLAVALKTVDEAGDDDWFAYDLVCLGFPSYQWSPPKPMEDYLNRRFTAYRKEGRIRVSTPRVGKLALMFCTYSGQHTGLGEAVPATLRAGQFFDHLGFDLLEPWHIVGQYHGLEEANTLGRLGDIRNRPNEEDLKLVHQRAVVLGAELLKRA
jgi:hypothetical protein